MPKKIRCLCEKSADCKLCHGIGRYEYTPDARGYIPFTCPTCEGKMTWKSEDGVIHPCKTCRETGSVDPANPPITGIWDVLSKILFGA